MTVVQKDIFKVLADAVIRRGARSGDASPAELDKLRLDVAKLIKAQVERSATLKAEYQKDVRG